MGAGHLLSNSKVLLYHRHVKMAHGEVVLDCVYTQATSTPQVQHNPSFLWNQHNNLSFWVHRSANWGSKTSSIWCDCTLWCRPVSDTPSTEQTPRSHNQDVKETMLTQIKSQEYSSYCVLAPLLAGNFQLPLSVVRFCGYEIYWTAAKSFQRKLKGCDL